METLRSFIPDSLTAILVTLALSFLIGFEREEHSNEKTYNFGGVRTFPIIGLCGYLMARLTQSDAIVIGLGFIVFGALFWLSYRQKLKLGSSAGMTSEVSGLFTFLLGALVYQGRLWESTTLAVLVLLLLELKNGLEALARKIPPHEIFTFTRFLLILAVVLPIVPNREFTQLQFNPFHMWLIVVAISSLSYIAYVLERLIGGDRSLVVAAMLGGVYSSTSATVVLAKKSQGQESSYRYTGAIVLASALMYFRLVVLLSIFNWELGQSLLLPFASLGILFAAVGISLMYFKKQLHPSQRSLEKFQGRNPLELRSAFLFAGLFTLTGFLSVFALRYFGKFGVYGLSFLSGLSDVDPFVMSLTQSSKGLLSLRVASVSIIIATASNNAIKGLYCALWGNEKVRKQASTILILLAVVSLLALFI